MFEITYLLNNVYQTWKSLSWSRDTHGFYFSKWFVNFFLCVQAYKHVSCIDVTILLFKFIFIHSYLPLVKFWCFFFGHVEKAHCFLAVEKKNRALGKTTLFTIPSIHRIFVYSRYLATINVLLKLPL